MDDDIEALCVVFTHFIVSVKSGGECRQVHDGILKVCCCEFGGLSSLSM